MVFRDQSRVETPGGGGGSRILSAKGFIKDILRGNDVAIRGAIRGDCHHWILSNTKSQHLCGNIQYNNFV